MSAREAGSDESDHEFAPAAPPAGTDYRHARWPTFPGSLPGAVGPLSPAGRLEDSPPRAAAILVVGVCSAGKSTLVANLRAAGYDARACAQEHSYVPHLWQLSHPVMLVYLDASLSTIRKRGRPAWTRRMLDEQHRRLEHARRNCDLYVATNRLAPEEVVALVTGYLAARPDKESLVRTLDS